MERTFYQSFLRKFALDELLVFIHRESVNLLLKENKDEPRYIKYAKVFKIEPRTRLIREETTIYGEWTLIEMAYNAILETNDYHQGKAPSVSEFNILCAETDRYIEEREAENREENGISVDILGIWGMLGEQIKIQNIPRVFQNNARDLYILFNIASEEQKEDYQRAVSQETGTDWLTVISSLFLAWVSFQYGNLSLLRSVQWDDKFKKEDFDKVIKYYTTDYKEVRSSALKRQVFYTKPFVKTQRGEIIAINSYLTLNLYEHSVYWIVREHYRKNSNDKFIREFGTLFEEYFREMLDIYVGKENYTDIEESKKEKRADWQMELCGYHFLIEQKSSLVKLAVKQQKINHKDTIEFADKTIIKAMCQLRDNESALGVKCIKIILLYEDYLIPETLNYIFDLPECDIANDHLYWIVTIEEMEMLLYTYNHNRSKFEKLIQERIRRETEPIKGEGKRFQVIFHQFRIHKNLHLAQQKFRKYENAAQTFLKTRLPAQ